MFEIRTWKGRVVLQVVLTLMVIPFLFPLIVMIKGSLAGRGFANYGSVFAVPGLGRFFVNSTLIAVVVVAIVYTFAMMAAFAFEKLYLHFREFFFWLLLACLTLPEVVLLAPLFATDYRFGLYDSYWAVILPLAALQIPFAVLLIRSFINGLPNELFEAARIDGAGSWGIFRYQVLPLTRPIGAAVVIFTVIGAWNDYLMPLVFLQSTSMQTITLVPQYFAGEFSNDQTKILAAAVITAIPEVVAYLCLQGLFERGLSSGAIK